MLIRKMILTMGAALLSAGVMAADPTSTTPTSPSTATNPADSTSKDASDASVAGFDSLDTNKNGSIDRTEAKYMPKLAQEFDRWDNDRSGSVNATEFKKFMEKPS